MQTFDCLDQITVVGEAAHNSSSNDNAKQSLVIVKETILDHLLLHRLYLQMLQFYPECKLSHINYIALLDVSLNHLLKQKS